MFQANISPSLPAHPVQAPIACPLLITWPVSHIYSEQRISCFSTLQLAIRPQRFCFKASFRDGNSPSVAITARHKDNRSLFASPSQHSTQIRLLSTVHDDDRTAIPKIRMVGSPVNWVKSNSGTIGTATSVIAKVAGMLEEDHDDPIAKLFLNFTKAAQKLKQAARDGADGKLEEILASLPEQVKSDGGIETIEATNLADSTFLWLDPAPLNQDGQPNKELVHDLGKMLAQYSFYTVFNSAPSEGKRKGSAPLDVALSTGQAISANMGTAPEEPGGGCNTE